ncbi:recombinase family protein [Parablautia muri]|uniref:Recombinase n=1 Tax=Parablautia muri TaxID=2320879 RepID=A0A9X5BIE1_9FIRM|nr:recombinase family protein [Parablautia muri]NBJ94311.1 recombinase [Parablautia muri]
MRKLLTAIYLRLSKEDDKWKEESNSITMQRILLRRYVEENFVDYEIVEFCDDGYTGTNFARPGVQEMLERIRDGEIKCVIVKDFSRFARDYIELGAYLEQIFPFLGVRFISVNDGYDSAKVQRGIADIDVNFQNLLYDLYSRDLSDKVRSSLSIRKEKGQYVSANPPFGYEKDPKDRHALLVAEDEAEVVRQIFTLTLEGYTSVEIAKLLNAAGVKTPVAFKIEKGKTSRIPKGGRFLWSSSTICKILRNEIYIGNIVQKKYTKDFVGGKNHFNPRENWLISYRHHEPIIDKEVFDKVQKGRGNKRPPQHHPTHPLVGKLVCGCCKKNLNYRRGRNPYFTCCNRYSNLMEKCVRRVNAMFAEQYVLLMMQHKLEAEGELEKLYIEEVERLEKELKGLREKKRNLLAEIEKQKQKNFEAYQDYAWGKAGSFQSDQSVVKSIENGLVGLNSRIQEAETKYSVMTCGRNVEGYGSWLAALSKDMIERYIDKIEAYGDQHMEISWKESDKADAGGRRVLQ